MGESIALCILGEREDSNLDSYLYSELSTLLTALYNALRSQAPHQE